MDNQEYRYFVDQRVGCIAVRDRERTNPQDQGLNGTLAGVVWFRLGKWKEAECDRVKDGGQEWTVPQETIDEATRICNELNSVQDYVI